MSKDLLLPHFALLSYMEHMEVERNVSKLTIRNYNQYLHEFIRWLNNQGYNKLHEITPTVIRQYRLYLSEKTTIDGEPITKKTQSYYVIAIRSWFKWLIKQDVNVLHPEKIDLPKAESQHMKFLSADKIEHLLAQPSLSTKTGLRDKALLEVLFSTGLRVSEVISLNRDNIDFSSKEFGVIGKGRRPRVVFLSDRAADWLQRWLRSRSDHWSPVFVRFAGKKAPLNADGEEMRLSTRSVQRIVDSYVKKAKLPIKVSPHGIRHSFATDLLANGAGLREVQELLGHKNVSTTQIYTHVTSPQLKQVHKKFHSQSSTDE